MQKIQTKIENIKELITTSKNKETFTQPYAPIKICQLIFKEWKLQKSNHECE
jgi:hypothetical protein